MCAGIKHGREDSGDTSELPIPSGDQQIAMTAGKPEVLLYLTQKLGAKVLFRGHAWHVTGTAGGKHLAGAQQDKQEHLSTALPKTLN